MGFPTGSPPQRSQAGISTSPPGYMFGDYPGPTPFRIHEVFSDFDRYLASDWTVTTTNAGTSALAAGNGGFLLQTTAATGTDLQSNQTPIADFAVVPGARMWFSMNINLNDASAQLFQAGFANSFAALAPTDGIYFSKAAASTTLNLILAKSSTVTTLAVGTLAAATAYTIGFYYDGKPTPNLYVYFTGGYTTGPTAFSQPYYTGGSQVTVSASADGLNPNPLTNLPLAATNLVAGFAIKASAAAAKTNTIDYFYAGNEILRF